MRSFWLLWRSLNPTTRDLKETEKRRRGEKKRP
jgi:hypothetical protein